ncbi:MAG: DNA-3-methyladenine glycosylase 2 family protein [Chloroflexi bacterium]|nr:DNA-3-methyladenine glycosylase 2 family protein [Chloroflexota bacterium]
MEKPRPSYHQTDAFGQMHITVTQPLSLGLTLECGQAFRWQRTGVRRSSRQGKWYYGVIHGSLVKLRQCPGGVEFRSSPKTEVEMEGLIKEYLRLGDDLSRIYTYIGRDEVIGQAISQCYGLRLLKQTPWECLISYLCSINTSIPRINDSIEKLCEKFGERLALEGHVRYSFPQPDRLAEAGERTLRAMRFGFRARFIAESAKAICEDKVNLESLRKKTYEEARGELMSLPGVGEKVADCVLLYSLDKLEAFPVDRWVRRAVEDWYFGGKSLSYKKIRAWAGEHFGAYAGYAQLFLFHKRRMEG